MYYQLKQLNLNTFPLSDTIFSKICAFRLIRFMYLINYPFILLFIFLTTLLLLLLLFIYLFVCAVTTLRMQADNLLLSSLSLYFSE